MGHVETAFGTKAFRFLGWMEKLGMSLNEFNGDVELLDDLVATFHLS